jgi:hypothetical protein
MMNLTHPVFTDAVCLNRGNRIVSVSIWQTVFTQKYVNPGTCMMKIAGSTGSGFRRMVSLGPVLKLIVSYADIGPLKRRPHIVGMLCLHRALMIGCQKRGSLGVIGQI